MEFYDDRHLQLSVQKINSIKNEINESKDDNFIQDKKKQLKNVSNEIKTYCDYKDYNYKEVKRYYYL